MHSGLPSTLLALSLAATGLAQAKNQNSKSEQNPAAIVRSPHSTKADFEVPLCPAQFEDGLNKNGTAFRGEDGVIPPKAEHIFSAELTDAARKATKHGAFDFEVVLNGVVELNGTVDEVCLSRSAGYGLDASAADSLRQSGFKPAAKDGKAVPFRTSFEVDFRQY
jgi:Gram-negative bacterial TonB protein C-terminal